jgi:MFS family permease
VTEAGIVLGVIGGTTGMLGTFLGGYLADRWGKNDKRWYVKIPLYGLALSFPLSYLTLLSSEPLYVILAYAPGHILNTLYLGPCIAICHTLVSPAMRASASAVLLFVINMIGLGLGPLFVGALSDAYSARFGDENLRYAMITSLTLGTSGLFFFWKAQKALLGDIEKAKNLSSVG